MRGREKKPYELAQIDGAASMSPARYRGAAPIDDLPALGEAPEFLEPAERHCYAWFASTYPWLKAGDQPLIVLLSKLYTKVIAGTASDAERGQFLTGLAKIGATPSDRTRLFTAGIAGKAVSKQSKYF
jgi:hypothetical protein